jgi:hypothetical protein
MNTSLTSDQYIRTEPWPKLKKRNSFTSFVSQSTIDASSDNSTQVRYDFDLTTNGPCPHSSFEKAGVGHDCMSMMNNNDYLAM